MGVRCLLATSGGCDNSTCHKPNNVNYIPPCFIVSQDNMFEQTHYGQTCRLIGWQMSIDCYICICCHIMHTLLDTARNTPLLRNVFRGEETRYTYRYYYIQDIYIYIIYIYIQKCWPTDMVVTDRICLLLVMCNSINSAIIVSQKPLSWYDNSLWLSWAWV